MAFCKAVLGNKNGRAKNGVQIRAFVQIHIAGIQGLGFIFEME
jgi:hypothetical protein